MKIDGSFRCLAVALSCALVMLPQLVQAAPPVATRPTVSIVQDVALHEGGILRGQVVEANGQRLVGAPVVIFRDNRVVAETVTNENGEFSATGLTGGVYQVVVGQDGATYRLWAPNTAPPSARSYASLVRSSDVVRGQGQSRASALLRSPWLWGGVVAAAIAIPLALDRDDAS